jgi:hypothetical protein
MLGVVIWTDADDSKAIIWCEDHGELAFLSQPAKVESGAEKLDQGDLIQFDFEEHRNLAWRIIRARLNSSIVVISKR